MLLVSFSVVRVTDRRPSHVP